MNANCYANCRASSGRTRTVAASALASLTLSLVLSLAAPAKAQGVFDPTGDANPFFANGNRVYDLTYTSVSYTATDAIFYARFANLVDLSNETNPDSLAGIWEVDTDQNPATGQPAFASVLGAAPPVNIGSDYAVEFFGTQFGGILGQATIARRVDPSSGFFHPIGNTPAEYGPNWVRTTVPLSLLGGDDGHLNYFAGFNPIGSFGPTDFAPGLVGANDFIVPAVSAAAPEPGTFAFALTAFPLVGLALRRWRRS